MLLQDDTTLRSSRIFCVLLWKISLLPYQVALEGSMYSRDAELMISVFP